MPRPDLPFAAALVDMDGLLVDSEPLWFEVEAALLAGYGVGWTPAQGAALVGNPIPVSAALLLAAGGRPDDPSAAAALADELVDGMTARLAERVPWKPGARTLLADLAAAGVPLALVSSSYRRLVDAVLGHLPAGAFATSVAGDEVRRPKPAPEPYLTAAARLGVDPRDCVVLEDSPAGVAAGEAAGAVVIAVPDLNPVGPAPRRPVLASLVGVRTADLAALVTAARAAGAAGAGPAIVAESGSSVTAP